MKLILEQIFCINGMGQITILHEVGQMYAFQDFIAELLKVYYLQLLLCSFFGTSMHAHLV